MSKNVLLELTTPFEERSETSWDEYPRPKTVRESYFCLNGAWELSVLGKNGCERVGEITVPFVPESRLSGIGRTVETGEKWLYRKCFTLPNGFNVGRVLLHFGAVDQIARVNINGHFLGEHIGGYLPFEFDITEQLSDGENTVEVEVTDELDTDIPYGKQRKKRGGMWYTPISGIWQTVWLESVPKTYISDIRVTPTLTSVKLCVTGGEMHKTAVIVTESGDVYADFDGDEAVIDIPEPHLWSPEDPYLYHFTLTSGDDTVRSYFALRTVTVEKRGEREYIALNGKPYFFHGLLDQGYFSDGIFLPASPDGYLWDIMKMKELGFNTLRKHIKIEPQLFYYYCDKYGMIVFQDMVNSGRYSFLIDTALPTLGLKRGITHKASKKRRERFESDCRDAVELLMNHPSVCYYTVFNEGWGQYDAERIYSLLKAQDGSRIWDSTSGWFFDGKSDVRSEHVYFRKLDLKPSELPLVLSEFGGYSCRIEGHTANPKKEYGYRKLASAKEFETALEKMYTDEVLPMIDRGLCAAILTQVSDIEDEINGLVTYDRRVVKVSSEVMGKIKSAIDTRFTSASDGR